MEGQAEKEKIIIAMLTEQFNKDGGNNGLTIGAFDHILNLNISDRNEFLKSMVKAKKIFIFQSLNGPRITLPK